MLCVGGGLSVPDLNRLRHALINTQRNCLLYQRGNSPVTCITVNIIARKLLEEVFFKMLLRRGGLVTIDRFFCQLSVFVSIFLPFSLRDFRLNAFKILPARFDIASITGISAGASSNLVDERTSRYFLSYRTINCCKALAYCIQSS